MSHQHTHSPTSSVSRKLVAGAILTTLFVAVQAGAGYFSGSLALVSDSIHNLTDSVALVLALLAVRLERRPPTQEKTFGYHRAGILAAFVNAATLTALTIFIFVEAIDRFRHPQPVNAVTMIAVSIVAIALNLGITLSLRQEGKHDVNIRAAVVHILGDAFSSGGIVVAAILIRVTGNAIWDPAISILIGVVILWSSWGILRESVNLLLEGTPAGIDPEAVTRSLAAVDGVFGVHHLHVWALGPSRPALSCHLRVGDVPVKSTSRLLEEITAMLEHEYRIVHTTIQFEYANCAEDDPFCIPYTGR